MDDKPKRKNESKTVKKQMRNRRIFIIVLGAIYGFAMQRVFAGNLYYNAGEENGMALVAFLGVVPLVIGAISVYMIPQSERAQFEPLDVFASAMFATGIFLVMTLLTSSGLIVCVLMALPFIFGFMAVGMGAMWIMRKIGERIDPEIVQKSKQKRKRYHAFAGFTLILPLIVAPIELGIQSPNWQRNVVDEIVINASAEAVWDNIIRMETIAPEEQRPSIYHSLGIPRPIKATLDYEGLGGVRTGYFEYGLTFVEEIIHWELNDSVRFNVDVHHNNQSTAVLKHIGGRYFDIVEAGYEIIELGDGQVLLRLDSDYRLSTNFNGYAAFWSDWIMHDFQNYVLNTVKNRVEAST